MDPLGAAVAVVMIVVVAINVLSVSNVNWRGRVVRVLDNG